MFDLQVWLALAACNRCGDYHTKRHSVVRAIQLLAGKYALADSTFAGDKVQDAKEQCRVALVELTQKLARHAAAHYRAGYTWESDWVTQILAQPENATKCCHFYDRQMWKDWNKRRNQAA